MILGRRELSVGLLMFGAVISIYLVLLAGPTSAQNGGGTTGIVVDFSVDVVQGECGAGECPDGTRPVTFEPELRVNVSESRQDLDAQEIESVNEILEGADVEVTVQVPGPDETVETGEPVCLESGQYEFTAEILNEGELATAIDGVIDGSEFMEEELVIEEFEDTFVVEECPDDNNGDTIDIDDRDQTNVCNNVVNIILDDVQNPDVDVDNDQVVSGPVSGNVSGDVSNEQVVEVSNEQVVDIAQDLNISPVIVQQCIQQNAGRDAIIIVDGV